MSNIHDEYDVRNIEIDNVGICNYKLPITFNSRETYGCIADLVSGVSLKSNIKGAHLSRIIEVLDELVANQLITIEYLNVILNELMCRLETDNANLSMKFNVVIPEISPITKRETYLNSEIILSGEINNNEINKNISLTATGAMLCPNSKAKSAYGAHSQKCLLKSTLYGNIDNILIEEVLKILFNQFSAEVYGIVKSPDEVYLTQKAYDNPKFSEDLVRDTLLSLREYYNGGMICTEIENLESIHQHNVMARGRIR